MIRFLGVLSLLTAGLAGCTVPAASGGHWPTPIKVGVSHSVDGVRVKPIEYMVLRDVGDPAYSKVHPFDRWVEVLWHYQNLRRRDTWMGTFQSNSSISGGRAGQMGPFGVPDTLQPKESNSLKLVYEVGAATRSITLSYAIDDLGGTQEATWTVPVP